MRLDDVYEGKWLKAEHLDEQPRLVTIAKVGDTEFQQKDGTKKRQIVLTFAEYDKPFGLNWTNAKKCAEICDSRDTDDWLGKKVVIYPTEVESFGETVEAIRMRAPKIQKKVAPVEEDPRDLDDELEDIPF